MRLSLPTPTGGIIFDLDGTLYRMKWFMRPLLMLRLFPDSFILPVFIRERERFAGNDLGSGDDLTAALIRTLSARTRRNSESVRTWINDRFYPAFVSVMRQFRGSRPGLSQVLANLRHQGIRLAVLSDYGMVRERLTGLGADPDAFDLLSTSEGRGALKPCPRPLLEIATAWNMPAKWIVVVGDRADTDGAAAQEAGMHFVQVQGGRGQRAQSGYAWEVIRECLSGPVPVPENT